MKNKDIKEEIWNDFSRFVAILMFEDFCQRNGEGSPIELASSILKIHRERVITALDDQIQIAKEGKEKGLAGLLLDTSLSGVFTDNLEEKKKLAIEDLDELEKVVKQIVANSRKR